jgi:uncharacterized cupredoxin-like copper-binding protein
MKYFTASILSSLMMVTSAVYAHGSSHDDPAKKPAFDPAAVEQKAFGKAADPKKATRTIQIAMNDQMRFIPAEIAVKEGEIIKFVVTNKGKLMHEMVIGTRPELVEHAEMMRKFPEMEHDEPHMAHVPPGKSETLAWHFNRAGDFEFACLLPGHFEAGMVGTISVNPAASRAAR